MSNRGFWDDNLLELQQKYWECWSELRHRALATEPSPKSPWEMALEHWWQAVAPAAPDMAKDFMSRMMDQGKQFFRMAELFSGADRPGAEVPDWMEVLNRISADPQIVAGSGGDVESQVQPGQMMGFWKLLFDSWQRMTSTPSLMPGELFGDMANGTSQSVMNHLFSIPGLGYMREDQAQQQELLRLIQKYQQAAQEYRRFFSDLGSESVQRLRDKLKQKSVDGEVIDSARILYDTWVTTCEEVYGEHVMTPDFTRINGQLINASMGVKHHLGGMIDEKLGSLHMPTRRELRTLQARMQENRRQNKYLRAELDLLKARLADLLSVQSNVEPATTIKRKALPKKKRTAQS